MALLVLPRVMARPDVAPREEARVVVDIDAVAPAEPDDQPEPRPQSAPSASASRRGASPRRARTSVAVAPPEAVPSPSASTLPSAAPEPPVRPGVARFALSAGSIAGLSEAVEQGASTQGHGLISSTAGDPAGPLPENAVDEPARIAAAAPPTYPESARRAEVELDLPLELVVSPQGRVVAARALTHPGFGLEEAALAAVRSYLFHPARRARREVPVRMKWMMQFRLH